ncbi:hypothetical protein ACFV97_01620 [Streptomyces sp. NPDC059913]|uniref:hypothetical protein n=1 Tax=unclassified Streptomyces TaxID=2593676 RepID=UPI00364E09B7
MQTYRFIVENLADTLTPGESASVRGTLRASSPVAARTAVEKSLRSRGYELTGPITVTPK